MEMISFFIATVFAFILTFLMEDDANIDKNAEAKTRIMTYLKDYCIKSKPLKTFNFTIVEKLE